MPEGSTPRRGMASDDDPAEGTNEDAPKESLPEGRPGGLLTGAKPRRGFLRPGRGQIVVAVLLALTSLLVVLTIRSQASQPVHSNLRREELIQLLDNIQAETRRLETDVKDLQATRDKLATGAAGAQAAQEEAQRRLGVLQIIGGTVPVHGPGVRIQIVDPQQKVTPELLLDALEELRDAGAEVIEFDDSVRVVASTWLGLDDQGRIIADGKVLAAPFVIDAIGDPATLEAGARFRGGLVSQVEGARVQGSVSIERSDAIVIQSVVTPRENKFALPN